MRTLGLKRFRNSAGTAIIAALALSGTASAEVRLTTGSGNSYRLPVMSWSEIPFRSVVRQQYDFSCGSAAVATLLSFHYGRATPERQVFGAMWAVGDQPVIRKSGFSMLDIKRYLDNSGYRTEGYRLSLDQLRRIERPGIVILDLNGYKHFVVIKGIGRDGVLVGDPMMGLKRYSLAAFKSHWNGIFLSIVASPHKRAPSFNLASDWQPWSTAPKEEPRTPISNLTNYLAPVYQITPKASLVPATGGNP